MRLSWLTFTPKQMAASDVNRPAYRAILKFAIVYGISFVMIILSWLSVALSLATIFYQKSKDAGAPPEVKELRWKLRNLDLSFDEIIEGMAKTRGTSTDEMDLLKSQIRDEMRAIGILC